MTIIPFDDRDGVIWMNGKMVPWRDAKTHVLNHGLHYASSVFEGERVYSKNVFKIKEHGLRLHRSANMLDFEIPYSADALDDATREVVKAQGVENGYVRRVAWRGSEMMAISAQHNTVHVAIACWAWPNMYRDASKDTGVRLKTSKWRRPSPDMAPCHSKAAGLYMICTMSKHAAEREGYHDALMLDYRGYVAEATGANIFLIIDGAIHTPTPDCFLDGITRRTIIGLAKARGYEVIERHIMPDEVAKASEVFLTGTAAEITPVGEIDGKLFEVGTITKNMIADYHALVNAPS